jgi:hypothetical protein
MIKERKRKSMQIRNVKINNRFTKEVQETFNGRMRKKLVTLNVKGKSWEQKKNLIYDKLIKIYNDIPEGVSFHKRKTKDIKNNPDGLRVFVKCDWIKRNRFDDQKGIFNFGTLIQAINRQIAGRTKKNILF